MHPTLELNWLGILVAVLASMIFGFLWYGPIFGKLWLKHSGLKTKSPPSQQEMMTATALQGLGTLLTAWVLDHCVQVIMPAVWGAGENGPSYVYGFMCAFFLWIGFAVPAQLGAKAWEMKSWIFVGINVVYHFFNLQLIAIIVALFH